MCRPCSLPRPSALGIYIFPGWWWWDLLLCLRSTSCVLLIVSGRWNGGRVEAGAHRHTTPLSPVQNRRNLLYGPSIFPLGNWQEMSLAKAEVIETERLLNKQTRQGVWTSEAGRGHGCCGHRMETIMTRCKQSDTHWTFLLPTFPPAPPIVWEISL